MVKTTKEQRRSLKRLFDRAPIYATVADADNNRRQSYREFRRTVQPEIGGYGAVMVPWAGMWVGIEKDGYTHT